MSFIAVFLAVTMLALTGKLQKHTGISFRFGGTFDKVVFVSDRNGAQDIWIMDPDGSNQQPLTRTSVRDFQPTWSPDGKRIMFVSDRSAGNAQIFVMRPDGFRQRQITSSTGAKAFPTFSPDGFNIAYLTAGRVFAVDLTGGHERPILPTAEQVQAMGMFDENMPYRFVCWASDSRTLGVIQQIRNLQFAQFVPRVGDNPIVMSDPNNNPLAANRTAIAWSKTDLKLAVALANTSGHHLVAISDTDTSRFQPILNMDGEIGPDSVDWAPDGRALAVGLARISPEGKVDAAGVIIVDVADGSITSIDEGEASDPRWSPDGKSILYVLKKDDKTDIWKYDLTAKKSVNLTGGQGNNNSPAWGPTHRSADAQQISLSSPSTDSVHRKQT